MSRLMKYPINVPDNVQFALDGNIIKFSGPLGSIEYAVPTSCVLKVDGRKIFVQLNGENTAMGGTVRQLVASKCIGVSTGFSKKLILKGVGYKANVSGAILKLDIGFSHSVNYNIPSGLKVSVEKNIEIIISGCDKHQVGQVVSEIQSIKMPEPYNGAGIHIDGKKFIMKQRKK